MRVRRRFSDSKFQGSSRVGLCHFTQSHEAMDDTVPEMNHIMGSVTAKRKYEAWAWTGLGREAGISHANEARTLNSERAGMPAYN